MDLDDSFTERLVQRHRARKQYLNEIKSETLSGGKKRTVLAEEPINEGPLDESTEDSPKRHCAEASQPIYSQHDKENFAAEESDPTFVPVKAASKARGLAALRKNFTEDEDEEMPPAASMETQVTKPSTYIYSTPNKDLVCGPKRSRLANLAADIRQWEDEPLRPTNNVTSNTPATKPVCQPPPNTFSVKVYYANKNPDVPDSVGKTKGPIVKTVPEKEKLSKISPKKGNIGVGVGAGIRGRLEAWDAAVKATLGSSQSSNIPKSSVIPEIKVQPDVQKSYSAFDDESSDEEEIDADDFNENYDQIKTPKKGSEMELDRSPVKPLKKVAVCNANAGNAAKVSGQNCLVPKKTLQQVKNDPKETAMKNAAVDPAELPLSARKALFEKALLGGNSKANDELENHKLSVVQRAALFEKGAKSPAKTAVFKTNSSEKGSNSEEKRASPVKSATMAPLTPSPSKNVGSHTRLMQQKLLEGSGSSLHGKEIAAKAVEERKQELSSLVNHWEKLSSSSTENGSERGRSNLTSDEQVSQESALSDHSDDEEASYDEQCDDEAVSEQLDEKQNIEREDSCNEESESYDESVFDSNQAEVDCVNSIESASRDEPNLWAKEERQISHHPAREAFSSQSGSSVSSYSEDSYYNASQSQSCNSGGSAESYVTSSESLSQKEVTSDSKESSKPNTPLMYTVSFYRKQKQETRLTPVRTIVRRENVINEEPPQTDFTKLIQEQIKALQEDVLRQQTVISQTSQALNLCSSTAEFSGSTEQVEGERLLLIATQKRMACLNEIQRLKTQGAHGEPDKEGKGTLTISDIQLVLKREFIASQLEGKGNDTVHYFLCLIRYGAQVIVTQMMSTDDKLTEGALSFTNHISLKNLPADFSVAFEVYAIQTKKEVLPHEKKYKIKREHSKIRLTPKAKKSDGKHHMPAISSPGGPSAVRSPSFGVVGFTRFTLQNCNKKTFTLDKVPFTSPLDGVLKVKLQLHADHKVTEKGFLTMFEDVSGFGAWHRRWYVLDAHYLSCWKYPDDENKKAPIATIDLKQCVTGEVKQVSRDICARPHTFQLVTVRPQAKGDKNTLISRSYNTLTTTKHLLSADTKEERIWWCNKLNEALTNVRKWDPQALRPIEALQH